MKKRSPTQSISRRSFVKMAGGSLAAAAGMGILPTPFKKMLGPVGTAHAALGDPPNLFFAGTDGWMSLPAFPEIFSASLGGVKTHPDNLAPAGLSTYIFGFRNVTSLTDTQRANQKNHAQHTAPLFWVDQFNGSNEFRMQLTNLGLAVRPDLFDAHTIHWHGFRNVIPFFDGEPTGSVAITTGRVFTYVYRPRDPGTYMFHCHVEDTEHVHMGMTGPVFVRPQLGPKFAYNDASTAFDRQYVMQLSEVWGDSHWADSHIQLPEWSDYRADFSLLNGRVYPDTLAPNAPLEPTAIDTPAKIAALNSLPVEVDATGDLVAPVGNPHLKYQPLSALVTCNAGERVLLRFANLGFREATLTLAGIRMRVVGKDATPMKGRDGTDTSYMTNTVSFGAGESFDAIFTAPAFSGGAGSSGSGYDTYLIYDRAYARSNNKAPGGFGGQRTEVRVYPTGYLQAQSIPHMQSAPV